jgi:S1-C subfamily serine protease
LLAHRSCGDVAREWRYSLVVDLIDSIRIQVSQIPASVAGDERASGGLYVTAVTSAGPSDAAGLRPGDIITDIDDEKLSSAEKLQGVTLTRRPGETVKVAYRRNGSTHSTTVTLGSLNAPR